jgi:chitin disaccharide deacetylase
MLIVSADDWGRNRVATNRIRECFERGSLRATGGMVFMDDSERAAEIARSTAIDVGLHVNLSEEFTGRPVPPSVRAAQDRVRRFLKRSKYSLLLYNPLLRADFSTLFRAQWDAFVSLYGRAPSHIDGHQHLHLCTNMLVQRILPRGMKVRRSFTFQSGQKNPLNRAYRAWVDRVLARRHTTTDFFFATSQHLSVERLRPIFALSATSSVELMVHPEVPAEYDLLMSDRYAAALASVQLGDFSNP